MPVNAVQQPNSSWLDNLAALIATGAPWDGVKMRLFKNNFQPNATTPLATFTEADFTGYVESTVVTWGTPFYLPSGLACVATDLKTFTLGPTPTILNTIYGWYLTDDPATKWIAARLFDAPIVLSLDGQAIQVIGAYPAFTTP